MTSFRKYTMRTHLFISIGALTLLSPAASGQSLFQQPSPVAPASSQVDATESLVAVSMYAIAAPKPRTYAKNDLITIIVREKSTTKLQQQVKEDKKYDNTITMINRKALLQFLQLRVPPGGQTLSDLDLASNDNKFDGKGKYDRNDSIESRLTARVLEVKPNGTLLLEANTTTQTDQEIQSTTLSGLCRTSDVTASNTVLSSQIYNLNLNIQHSGQVRRATKKGLIPRIIETIFNF